MTLVEIDILEIVLFVNIQKLIDIGFFFLKSKVESSPQISQDPQGINL